MMYARICNVIRNSDLSTSGTATSRVSTETPFAPFNPPHSALSLLISHSFLFSRCAFKLLSTNSYTISRGDTRQPFRRRVPSCNANNDPFSREKLSDRANPRRKLFILPLFFLLFSFLVREFILRSKVLQIRRTERYYFCNLFSSSHAIFFFYV